MKVGAKERYTKDDVKRWREKQKSGWPLTAIAAMEKASLTTIARWLAKDARGEI